MESSKVGRLLGLFSRYCFICLLFLAYIYIYIYLLGIHQTCLLVLGCIVRPIYIPYYATSSVRNPPMFNSVNTPMFDRLYGQT